MAITRDINGIRQEQGRSQIIRGYDNSKLFREDVATDNRKGAMMADLLNFTPYEKGYCFLVVMSVPKFMIKSKFDNKRETYYEELMLNFVDIIEKEFIGLSGIDDQVLGTTSISDNRNDTNVVTGNNRSPYTTVETTYTEQSGLPITKFLELYTRLLHDPYTQAKTYGGRLRASDGTSFMNERNAANFTLKDDLANETFDLLYVITDNTCLLVEKAFVLYNAQPMNASYSSLFNMNKFEFSTQAISINWNCTLIDGKVANRLGQVYIRYIMDYINTQIDPLGSIPLRGGQIKLKEITSVDDKGTQHGTLKFTPSTGRWENRDKTNDWV